MVVKNTIGLPCGCLIPPIECGSRVGQANFYGAVMHRCDKMVLRA